MPIACLPCVMEWKVCIILVCVWAGSLLVYIFLIYRKTDLFCVKILPVFVFMNTGKLIVLCEEGVCVCLFMNTGKLILFCVRMVSVFVCSWILESWFVLCEDHMSVFVCSWILESWLFCARMVSVFVRSWILDSWFVLCEDDVCVCLFMNTGKLIFYLWGCCVFMTQLLESWCITIVHIVKKKVAI